MTLKLSFIFRWMTHQSKGQSQEEERRDQEAGAGVGAEVVGEAAAAADNLLAVWGSYSEASTHAG